MEFVKIPMSLKHKMKMEIMKGGINLNSKKCLREILVKMNSRIDMSKNY